MATDEFNVCVAQQGGSKVTLRLKTCYRVETSTPIKFRHLNGGSYSVTELSNVRSTNNFQNSRIRN